MKKIYNKARWLVSACFNSYGRFMHIKIMFIRKIIKVVIVNFLVFSSCISVVNAELKKEKVMSAKGVFDVTLEPQNDSDMPA